MAVYVSVSIAYIVFVVSVLAWDLVKPAENVPVNTISGGKIDEHRVEEWKTVVSVQMHFNEMIIKFRTIVLSTFLALSGAILALRGYGPSPEAQGPVAEVTPLLLTIPVILFLLSFIMDYFYYNRLLLGAVSQATKFDTCQIFADEGRFGLTTCLKNHINVNATLTLIAAYYLLPVILTLAIAIALA